MAGGITSASGLSYSSTCQVGTGDGVTQIDVTIGVDHSILAGNLYYVHQDAGVADVNMTLTTLDVGGVVYDFYYGNIIVLIDNAFNGQGTVALEILLVLLPVVEMVSLIVILVKLVVLMVSPR